MVHNMKIIHITDFHLVAPGRRLCGLDPQERLERCLNDIARWHADAEFCVISGDLCDKGDPAAYAWLSERLKQFPLKTFIMIGNHDDRDALCAAFPDVSRDSNGFVQYVHSTAKGLFIFLDTHKGPVSEGRYCQARRAWLTEQLDLAGGQPLYLFMHHPPFDIGIPYMDRIKLEEPEAFAEVLAGRDNIRHIFFGHVHRAAYVNWKGIACTCLPSTNHQVPLRHDSVGADYSIEPAMYAVVLIDGEQMTVHFDACLDRRATAVE